MTEEEVKDLLKEASEKIKEDFIPAMKNLLMDVFQHGINKGSELGMKVASDASKSKSQTLIKWQTGKPKRVGSYILSLKNGSVAIEKYFPRVDEEFFEEYVVAWCHIGDIEPYKPKDDGIITL